VIVLFVVLVLYVNPLSNFFDAWQERKAEESRLAEVKAEHEELTRRATSLEDPNAAEREARKLGMVGPTERPYVIRGIEP
jgi:cell division protein FtsB